MQEFLWAGTFLGAVFGLIHAIHNFRQRMMDPGSGLAGAFYFALWTFALWTLFGAYLLVFWIIGAVGLAISRLKRPAGAMQ